MWLLALSAAQTTKHHTDEPKSRNLKTQCETEPGAGVGDGWGRLVAVVFGQRRRHC